MSKPRRLRDPKQCTSCGAFKARDQFYPHSTAPRGVSSWCKACTNERSRDGQRANPERAKASLRKSKLMRDYGLTLDDYAQMLDEQGGGCAICGAVEPGGRGRFHIDHCHATGVIRGLLCSRCNVGLGHFGDDAARMRLAIAYLERSR